MSNGVVVPVQPRRSLAGPIVLITIGVIFLLGNLGVITWENIASGFAKYWPVLIILWGVTKMIEHYQARNAGLPSPGIGAGGVFFLIVLVIFGMSATGMSRLNWEEISEEIDVDGHVRTPWFSTYDDAREIVQPAPQFERVRIKVHRGDVQLVPASDGQLRILVNKRLVATNQEQAKQFFDKTQPKISMVGSVLNIEAYQEQKGRTDMEIHLPAKGAVEIETERGDIQVRGWEGTITTASERGDVQVEDIKGSVEMRMEHGDVQARNVAGDITVEGDGVSDVEVTEVTGALTLRGEFHGSSRLSKIAGGVRFDSNRTELAIAKLDGDMDFSPGDLRASTVTGPFTIRTSSTQVMLDDVTGDVKVETSNADVRLSALKPLGNIQVENSKGGIRLELPSDGSFELDARSENGEINTDFSDLAVTSEQHDAIAKGKIGNGNAKITLTTDYDDIRLLRR